MIEEEFVDNNFIKLNSYLGDSISITALNDDTSTYMGVKSVTEDQSTIINDSKIENNKKNKVSKKKKKPKKKEKSISSDSESKSSESSSPKEKQKERNSLTDLLQKAKDKEKEKGEDQKDENQEEENKKNKENLEQKKIIEEIDTKFEWEGSGKIVYVTGSFCDWKKFYIMTKNTKGIFSLTLSLPRGFHQYKFKVDNNWTYSKIHPKYEDNGNVNNYIDTTDYTNSNENEIELDLEKNNNLTNNEKKVKEKEKEKEKSKGNNKKKKNNNKSQERRKIIRPKKRNSSILSVNFLNSQNYYTIYYPLRSEFNKKPVSLPGLYKTCFILNEDIKKKKEMKFSDVEYVNNSSSDSSSMTSSEKSLQSVQSKISILGEVIPYVKFQNLYHIHSNHLHSKLFYNYDNTIIDSMTTRYRYKFSTFIYYKPNEPVIPLKRIKHSKSFKIKSKK